MKDNKPTLAFATMCKNEESVIRGTLDSLAPYIDYLVFVDTGSTDKTVEIVEQFMKETGIPGEIHVDEWVEFDYNKTKMMEHAFGKADYIVHLDSHMHLQGDFEFTADMAGKDSYDIEQRRGSSTFSSTILWKGDLKWRFVGVRHTIMKCDSNYGGGYTKGTISNCWIQHGAGGMGSRTTTDPNKYGKDAMALEDQFWRVIANDPDGIAYRSVFYAAQSWFDQGDYQKSMNWYTVYTKLKDTWFEEEFEANLKIAKCRINLGQSISQIKPFIDRAIQIEPERAEPYALFARHIFYNAGEEKNTQLAYSYMKRATECDLKIAKSKYILFINDFSYGKYLYDDFSVMCYHAGYFEEGMSYLQLILNDPNFKNQQERLIANEGYFKKQLSQDKKSSEDISIALFTIVRNEKYFLPIFLNHYRKWFSDEDIFVLDDNTIDGSTDNITCNVINVDNEYHADAKNLLNIVTSFQHKLIEKYDVVVFAECDELICTTEHGGNLIEFIKERYAKGFHFLKCKGYEIIHDPESEPDFDFSKNITSQRNNWFRLSNYDKSLILSEKANWVKGFHELETENMDYVAYRKLEPESNLYLIHLHRLDFKMHRERKIFNLTHNQINPDEPKEIAWQNKIKNEIELDKFFLSMMSYKQEIPQEIKNVLHA